jgi:hypothetical protein
MRLTTRFSAEVKNVWSSTSVLLCAFMEWCLIICRHSFTFLPFNDRYCYYCFICLNQTCFQLTIRQREKGTNIAGCYSLASLSEQSVKIAFFCISCNYKDFKFPWKASLDLQCKDRQVTDRSASSHRIYLALLFQTIPVSRVHKSSCFSSFTGLQTAAYCVLRCETV